jgi:hypothetical protein
MGEWIDDGVSFHEDLISIDPFILGKAISWDEALAANPLDEKSRKNEAKRLKNMREVKNLEAKFATKINYLSQGRLENGEIVIDLDSETNPFRDKRFVAAWWAMHHTVDLMDMVDSDNVESYGTIYAGSDYWIVSPLYPQLLAEDPNKLWESATLEQFQENGKYNQISLRDDGTLYLTVIKPGAVESIKLEIPANKVEAIRAYIKQYQLNWDSTNEGWINSYRGLGGVYQFMRVIPLLREGNWGHNIDIIWHGNHRNAVIEGGPFAIKDTAKLSVLPASYPETE